MPAERHPFPPFPWKTLRRPLTEDERAELCRGLRGLLRFQRTLDRWPRVPSAPDATAFVSLYANGRLCGCQGSAEGAPVERLARAFFCALHDGRFPPVSPEERGAVAAQASYVFRPRLLNPNSAPDELEIGTHGVALVRERVPGVMILPHVARDERLGPRELLAALLRKARLPDDALGEHALYAFEAEDVTVHGTGQDSRLRAVGAEAAAAWLSSLVDGEGAVTFAIDPRARRRVPYGEMHHGRAAMVVQALAAYGRRPVLVARARQRLEKDIRAALSGAAVGGWSDNPELIAGTLALAILAGIPLECELAEFIETRHMPRRPWHGAQVVAALGRQAPADLWTSCVADLDRHPFAPWTLIAAETRGDRAVRARVSRAVAASLRKDAPHRGAVSVTSMPETAVTALAVEALARHEAPWARSAVARGREFLGGMQLLDRRVTACLDPGLAYGAFSATPAADLLRCDISAHALLAILTGKG